MKRRVGEVGYILSGLARELYETGGNRPVFMVKNIDNNEENEIIIIDGTESLYTGFSTIVSIGTSIV